MKKKILSLALAVVLILGLATPAVAVGQTFSDVPSSYWGYADIEAVAEAGLMNGTGNGAFSPEMKVSVAQFLTLLGRLVFPDTKVAEGDTWYGPYVIKAQEAGLLIGTQVDTGNVEAEISRYDMAVILRAAAKKLGVAEKTAQQSEVTDYGMVPNMYTEAVLAVYGMGLIKGDQNGNFNGGNTMMRAEVATVIMRLARTKPSGTTEPEKPTETGQPTEPNQPDPVDPDAEPVTRRIFGWLQYNSHGDPEKNGIGVADVPIQIRFTQDNGATYTVVAECMTEDGGKEKPTGRFDIRAQVEKSIFTLYESGKGQFYISAEAMVNGQRYVTQDRRTDGKATVIPIGRDWGGIFVDLVPPNGGEMMDLPVAGIVTAKTYVGPADRTGEIRYYGSGEGHQCLLTNSTVRIYFDPQQEGVSRVLIAETTADGGFIKGTVSIDSAYYRTKGAYYVVEIEAFLDGQLCTNTSYNAREPITLSQLKGEHKQFWNAESDEYWEVGLGTTRP